MKCRSSLEFLTNIAYIGLLCSIVLITKKERLLGPDSGLPGAHNPLPHTLRVLNLLLDQLLGGGELLAGSLQGDLPLDGGAVSVPLHIHPAARDPLYFSRKVNLQLSEEMIKAELPDVVPLSSDDSANTGDGYEHGESLYPGLVGDGLMNQNLKERK